MNVALHSIRSIFLAVRIALHNIRSIFLAVKISSGMFSQNFLPLRIAPYLAFTSFFRSEFHLFWTSYIVIGVRSGEFAENTPDSVSRLYLLPSLLVHTLPCPGLPLGITPFNVRSKFPLGTIGALCSVYGTILVDTQSI